MGASLCPGYHRATTEQTTEPPCGGSRSVRDLVDGAVLDPRFESCLIVPHTPPGDGNPGRSSPPPPPVCEGARAGVEHLGHTFCRLIGLQEATPSTSFGLPNQAL